MWPLPNNLRRRLMPAIHVCCWAVPALFFQSSLEGFTLLSFFFFFFSLSLKDRIGFGFSLDICWHNILMDHHKPPKCFFFIYWNRSTYDIHQWFPARLSPLDMIPLRIRRPCIEFFTKGIIKQLDKVFFFFSFPVLIELGYILYPF